MPPPGTSARYAEAVRARRAELRAAPVRAADHRSELRGVLAVARLAAAAQVATEIGRLQAQAREVVDHARRTDRIRFPALLAAAVEELRRWSAARHGAVVHAAARRVAGRYGLALGPLPGEPPGELRLPAPDPAPSPLAGIAGGWRTALLPAAALPLLGLPVAGELAAVAAVGLGAVAAAAVGLHGAAGADRRRLHRWCHEVLAVVRADADAALARLLVRTEQVAGAELDGAVGRRRAAVEAELAELAPAREVSGGR